MLMVRVYINLDEIEVFGVRNVEPATKDTKPSLYEIVYPQELTLKFRGKHIKHKRADGALVLVKKAIEMIIEKEDTKKNVT